MSYSLITSNGPIERKNKANFEQLINVANNVIEKDNTTAFTPTGDYNPSTKKYVDDSIENLKGNVSSSLDTLEKIEVAIDNLNANDTVAGSVDYKVKNAIDNIVNGAPGALDTLKEISDQLANDESVVNALINTVSSNQSAIEQALSDAIAQEVSDRDSAILTETNRAEGVESNLQSQIDNISLDSSELLTHRILTNSITLTANDRFVDFNGASGKTITLYSFSSVPAGRRYVVEINNFSANPLTINLGSTTDTVVANESVSYKLDSVGDWSVL